MRGNLVMKPLNERILDASARASQWLGDANEANERGDREKAEQCYLKAQYWLDRYNLLANRSDKAAPTS